MVDSLRLVVVSRTFFRSGLDLFQPAFQGVARVAYFLRAEARQVGAVHGPDAEIGKGGTALVEVGAVEFFQDDAVGVAPVARVEGGQTLFGVETGGAEVAVDPF